MKAFLFDMGIEVEGCRGRGGGRDDSAAQSVRELVEFNGDFEPNRPFASGPGPEDRCDAAFLSQRAGEFAPGRRVKEIEGAVEIRFATSVRTEHDIDATEPEEEAPDRSIAGNLQGT
jgi:hypothetical protein